MDFLGNIRGKREHVNHDDDPENNYPRTLKELIMENKALAFSIIGGLILLISLGIFLLTVLISVAVKAWGYIDHHGIKGVIEQIMPILQRIWEGKK